MHILFQHTQRERQGEILIFLESILWGLFPIVSLLTFFHVPIFFTAAISSLLAALFFALVVTIQRNWKQPNVRDVWKELLLIGFLLGFTYYALIYLGLSMTTAGDASIMMLMEVFFSMVILKMWNKEHLGGRIVAGAVFMVFGAFLILFKGNFELNIGNLVILGATAVPPVGNYFSQQVRKKISSSLLLCIRSLIGSVLFFILAFSVEDVPLFGDIHDSLFFLFLNGFFLFGLSKILWVEAIHRIAITKAVALNALSPAFTIIFAYFLLSETPTASQLAGFLPIVLGVFLLSGTTRFSFLGSQK